MHGDARWQQLLQGRPEPTGRPAQAPGQSPIVNERGPAVR